MPSDPVCVLHRDGWCATRRGRLPRESDVPYNQRTLCGYYVYLPMRYEVRQPDCPDCLRKLKEAPDAQ